MAMLGKMAISASFNMLYLYTGELMPTVVRSVGLGSCSMVARIAGMVAVYSSDLVSHIFMLQILNFLSCMSNFCYGFRISLSL